MRAMLRSHESGFSHCAAYDPLIFIIKLYNWVVFAGFMLPSWKFWHVYTSTTLFNSFAEWQWRDLPPDYYTSQRLFSVPLHIVLPDLEAAQATSERVILNDFVDVIPACDKMARKAFVAGWEREPGVECFMHELSRLRRLCCQIHCLVLHVLNEFGTCLAGWNMLKDNGTCGEFAARFHRIFNASFSMASCGVLAGLTKLSSGSRSSGCFAIKQSLYEDIDHQSSKELVDFIGNYGAAHLSISGGTRHNMQHQSSLRLQEMMVNTGFWADHLRTLWVLHRASPSGTETWPLFRFPEKRALLRRPAQVLANIISFLHGRKPQRRMVFAEVGVFLGNTSEELIRSMGRTLQEVHLIDVWEDNAELRSISGETHTPWPKGCGRAVLGELRRKMAALPKTALCGSFPPVTNSNCCSDVGCVSVTLHHAASTNAALHLDLNSIDLVFIDGSHSFSDVLTDLTTWWSRVRPGGVLAGHDFSTDHPDVPFAVMEFLRGGHWRLPVNVVLDAALTFWIQKTVP